MTAVEKSKREVVYWKQPDQDDDPVGFYAHHVLHYLVDAIDDFIAAGKWFIQAKAELKHGQFGELCNLVGISQRSAQRYMAIASNAVIGNPTRVSHLPTSVGALYELTRVPDDVLIEAIETGEVTPNTHRSQAKTIADRHRRAEEHAARIGVFATSPAREPQYGPFPWECGPEPAVTITERLVRKIVAGRNGLGLQPEPFLESLLADVVELAPHVGVEKHEIEQYAIEATELTEDDRRAELADLLEFADRIGYTLGEGFDGIVVERDDPQVVALGGFGTLPDDILPSVAWVYLNVRLMKLLDELTP
jgi:hypothetical protein